jgi:rubredoxin
METENIGPTPSSPPTPDQHLFECAVCGYVYDPREGDPKRAIAPDTSFALLPDMWRCPVCNSRKDKFQDIGVPNKPSGFAENLGYGLGVNVLTPTQKNLLIFGGLAIGFLFFMSFYAVD